MRTNRTRTCAVVLGAVMAFALGGCASPAEPVSSSVAEGSVTLEQIIDDGLAAAGSDFQTEVLTRAQETGAVSEEDWKEANNKFKDCMVDKGYEIELIYDGANVTTQTVADVGSGGEEQQADAEKRRADDQECYEKTSAFINEAYSLLNGGSVSVSADEMQRAVLQCLIDRELVPAETTYEEFVADLEQNEGKQFSPQGTEENDPVAACWMENS